MGKTTSLLLSLCAAATCGESMAQQLYKTVGADGKVTFSDRPKVEEKARLSVMHAYTLRPVEPPPVRSDAQATIVKTASKREGAASASTSVVTPSMEEAIVNIMGMSAFGGRFEIFCNTNDADTKAFSTATLGWKNRNAAAVEHQKRVLTVVLSPSKRAELVDREEALLAEQISKMSGRSAAARKEWCDGVVAELNSGQSDISNPALMAVAIVPFKAK